jgi:hypothetical protein
VRFGFVGSLVWYKGGEVLLQALRLLSGKRAVLHVHGDFQPDADPHHARLRELAGPNVRFHGRFDNARLSEVYAEIDVLVVPSIWFENSPITIHEAFLTHTPVVASDIGGMLEYVRDGVDGLHFRAGDAQDLARVLNRFVDEPGLVQQLGRDWLQVKTIAEDAAATEFRYRGLLCRVRPAAAPAGRASCARSAASRARRPAAPVDQQGDGLLLLRPGAAVEYDISGSGGGTRRLRVEQLVLGAESSVVLGGRVLVDGLEVGRLELAVARGRDELVARELDLELPADARRLRLETAPGAHLRVQRVQLSTVPEAAAARAVVPA